MHISYGESSPNKPTPSIISTFDPNYIPPSVAVTEIPDVHSIVDGLQKCHAQLDPFNPTLIRAPTGFGKTFFVIHKLLPQVIAEGGKMLFVSNRVAASVQPKYEIMELLNDPEAARLNDNGIQRKTDFGTLDQNGSFITHVKIMTLQALAPYLRTPEGRAWCRDVSVLVVDEAHFFIADALFNEDCDYLLTMIPSVFNEAIRVYMTATSEDVLLPLADAEADCPRPLKERIGVVPSPLTAGRHPTLQLLHFTGRGYDHVNVRYFQHQRELISHIKSSPSEERWFIFVASKDKGSALAQELGADATFLTADDKGSSEWTTLISTQKLPSRILISTAVLDCGVNFHDDTLRHVVIMTEDRVTFLQALGRKRCKPNERFTLYVPALNKKRIAGIKAELQNLLSLAEEMDGGGSNAKLFARLWTKGTPVERLLTHVPFGGSFRPNKAALFKLRKQAFYFDQLEALIESDGASAFPQLVHQWLGQENSYREENWLHFDAAQAAQNELGSLLESYEGKELLTSEDQKAFSEQLVALHERLGHKAKRTDRSDYLQERGLNNCLQELGLPYRITKPSKDSWLLQRNEAPDCSHERV